MRHSFLGLVLAGLLVSVGGANARPSTTTVHDTLLEYRGFTINVSALQGRPDRDSVVKWLKQQVDIVADASPNALLEFFKSIPMKIDSAATDSTGGGNPGYYHRDSKSVTLAPKHIGPNRPAPMLLHELLHAYHDQKLDEGYRNPVIRGLFQAARERELFPAKSCMMVRPNEYFAMAGAVYLHGTANRDPFTREAIRQKQPELFDWLVREFGAR